MSEETKPEGQNLSVTVKKKRMSESQGETGKEDSRDASVKPAPRRNSTGSVNSHNYVKSEARIDKANEGLSPTLVNLSDTNICIVRVLGKGINL